ncbi:MAG: CvpA family protein, partial [Pseudomonadota bacterium]|nr:CvpA family protein [Pseudomonadota bacterium]
MNWADWGIAGILLVSSLIGLKRGFIKEALSVLCWVAAFVVAMTFRDAM